MFHSIILTVHNKGWLLPKVFEGIFQNTQDAAELIVVLDGCTDNSEEVTNKCLRSAKIKTKIIHTPDVFETLANNAGLKEASGDFCTIIQDDMIVKEKNWNLRMEKPFIAFKDVFAVTARAAHNWKYEPNNKQEKLKEIVPNHWGDIIHCTDLVNKNNVKRTEFTIRLSANRGPLMLKHESLRKLNYLDPLFAPLDMDDHDLCMRAYKQLGQVAGCYWIEYESDINWGGTRANDKIVKLHRESQQKNAKIVWARHRDLILGPKHSETRRLP